MVRLASAEHDCASSSGVGSNKEREWSELIPDMLHLVSRRLPDICDLVRFGAVCKSWHSEGLLSSPPSLLPWLLTRSTATEDQLQFYSLSHDKFQTISVPVSRGKELMGPAQSYVFTSNLGCSSMALLNPLTRKEVPLPPIDLDWCFPICTSQNDVEFVAICGGKCESKIQTMALCHPGDGKWMTVRKALEGCLMIYYKGMFFVYCPETGATEIIEVTTGTVVTTVPPPPTKLNYLVESCGELLGISCNHSTDGSLDLDSECKIYRLDYEDENCSWVKVSSIDDRTLFLDAGQGLSINASDANRSERNCIFYLGSQESIKFDGVSRTYYLCKYDVEARTWEKLSLPSMEKPSWFLPSHDQ